VSAGDVGFGGFVRPTSPVAAEEPRAAAPASPDSRPASSGPAEEPSARPARGPGDVQLVTTDLIDGYRVHKYLGVIGADVIQGANVLNDLFASVRDKIGGRAAGYEKLLAAARRESLDGLARQALERGANAVLGIDLDYEVLQIEGGGNMLMVTASGTAAVIKPR
jgi:uncharacterized protein YbjQ (UPF0145 family)